MILDLRPPVVIGRRSTAQWAADVVAQCRTAVETADAAVTELQQELADAVGGCVANHGGLVERNSRLQALNIKLAHDLEHAELHRAQAQEQNVTLLCKVDTLERQLRAIGVEPLTARGGVA